MTSTTQPGVDLRAALEGCLGIPFLGGNRVEVLRNGVQAFPAMLEAIEQARETIEFETFVYWRGDIARRFAEILASKAAQGVRVQVLLDAVGSMPMRQDLIELMRRSGVKVVQFRPVARWQIWRITHRTHRKVLVCDGTVGFTGGFGIACEWEGDARNPEEWRDTHFRFEGPIVRGLQAAFCGNWLESGHSVEDAIGRVRPIEPAGDVEALALRTTASPNWSDAATLLRTLIAAARQRIRIATAYFVPDEHSVQLLCKAARRGVEVDILLPGEHVDYRLSKLAGADAYRPLLQAGVRIHEFRPTMMHCKVFTVDGQLACVGSANFNQRSMSQDDEICVVVADEDVVRRLDRDYEDDLERSEQIALNGWEKRGPLRRIKETLSSIVRPQT